MKKHLMAAAVAGAIAVPAMAQVTVYGRLDQGYNTVKATSGATVNAKTTGIGGIASGNRIGFRGEEDLGGGLKANFTAEFAFAPDENESLGQSGNRQSFLGFSGGFGSVTVGRQYTLIHSIQGALDPNGNATAAGWLAGLTNSARADDAIIYTTPSLQGFTGSVLAALPGSETSTAPGASKAGDITSIALAYTGGPLSVRAVQESTKNTALSVTRPGQTAATALSDALAHRKAQSIGASYDFGPAAVYYINTSAKGGSTADTGKLTSSNIGLRVPLGAITVNATMSTGRYTDSGAAGVGLSGYLLGANYALSKRTAVYTFLGQAQDKLTTNAGKRSTFAVGVGHNF